MINKKNKIIGIFLVLGIILFLGIVSSYSMSSVQYSQYQAPPGLYDWKSSLEFQDTMCQEGVDFLIQVAPLGCTPTVVRSDLLEEQNVPVFCPLVATKINPLIDVQAIQSLSFSGQYPPEVAGVGFEPYRSSLGGGGDLNRPTLFDNIGYAVIVLKQQPSERNMSDWVEGNLSVKIKYDIKNAFGIGKASFHLPVLNDFEWEARKNQYSFWNGKGFVRAEAVEGDRARITIYDGKGAKYQSFDLSTGESSQKIYLPGFHCLSSLEVNLQKLSDPDTMVKLIIDDNYVEVGKGQPFLEDRCTVVDLFEAGLMSKTIIRCKEDSGTSFRTTTHGLSVIPKMNLTFINTKAASITPETGEYGVGDLVYKFREGGETGREYYVYLGYAQSKSGLVSDLELGFIAIPEESVPVANRDRLDESSINYLARVARAREWESAEGRANVVNFLRNVGEGIIGIPSQLYNIIVTGKSIAFVSDSGKQVSSGASQGGMQNLLWGDRQTIINGFAGSVDIDLNSDDFVKTRENYELAKNDFEKLISSYPSVKHPELDKTFGEEALRELIVLNSIAHQKRKVSELCEEFTEKYKDSFAPSQCNEVRISNSEMDTTLVNINGRLRVISLAGIYEPGFEDYSAEVLISGPNREQRKITLTKGNTYFLSDFRYAPNELIDLGGNLSVKFDTIQNNWFYSVPGFNSLDPAKDVEKDDNRMSKNMASLIRSLDNASFEVGRLLILNELGSYQEAIELVEIIDENRIRVNVYVWGKDVMKRVVGSIIPSESHTLNLRVPETLGSDYRFTLDKINLKKSAVVTINPGIDKLDSEANVSFKIGIEKRGIQLSPNRIKEKIANLDREIKKWNETSEKLGTVVKGLKSACLVGGLALTVKNFFANTGGQGIARQTVMNDVWSQRCANLVKDKTYSTLDECYFKNSDKIDKDVSLVHKHQQDINQIIQSGQKDYMRSDTILGANVDEEDYMKDKRIGEVNRSLAGMSIDASKYINEKNYNAGAISPQDLRDIEVNAKILNDPSVSPELRDAANRSITNSFQRIDNIVGRRTQTEGLADTLGIPSNKITELAQEGSQSLNYEGLYGRNLNGLAKDNGLNESSPVQVTRVGQTIYVYELSPIGGEGGGYTVKSDANGLRVFDATTGDRITQEDIPEEIQKVRIEEKNPSSYEGKGFTNLELKYYDTGRDKGLPAIVPFDRINGWYAATKPTLPGSITSAYDASGRLSSFWLCHVGDNGLQEFNRPGFGDDTCQMINLGIARSYNQFSGLNEAQTSKYVDCGIQAIQQASSAYKSDVRNVRITTPCGSVDLKVGEPSVNLPAVQCQDFMSPKDCQLLYNLCDPVLCPASRCNLGGAYPVRDPIQTGLLGGFLLCLPNIREGVYIPICLTGIQAGLDGWISVLSEHRKCLQENLDTGRTIGICDQIYSMYVCDFVWRQAFPFAEVALPKLISSLVGGGAGARGGGEYMNVQSAWDTAGKSFSFFTQTYAVNSFKAFQGRTFYDVGEEVCKNYISGVVPSIDMLDKLTEPDSPFQFMGRFEEIPYTSTSVPPMSQYKVYYHIYSGKDSSSYFRVYLKGAEGTYYRDAAQPRSVAQGHIAAGGTASETRDFLAPSGYTELCIDVNGQLECGFKQVTTNFAMNYVSDMYIQEQAEQRVASEQECISGSASVYSLLNPNLQSSAESIANPSVYQSGLIRVCSTSNPGKGLGETPGEGDRWRDVGHCGDTSVRCWLDTSRIKDITHLRTTEDGILETLKDNTLKLLENPDRFKDGIIDDEIRRIKALDKNEEKIRGYTELLDSLFYDKNVAWVLLERGIAYRTPISEVIVQELKALAERRDKNIAELQTAQDKVEAERIREADEQRKIIEGEEKVTRINELLKNAREAINNEDYDKAEEYVWDIFDLDLDNKEAEKLLDEITKKAFPIQQQNMIDAAKECSDCSGYLCDRNVCERIGLKFSIERMDRLFNCEFVDNKCRNVRFNLGKHQIFFGENLFENLRFPLLTELRINNSELSFFKNISNQYKFMYSSGLIIVNTGAFFHISEDCGNNFKSYKLIGDTNRLSLSNIYTNLNSSEFVNFIFAKDEDIREWRLAFEDLKNRCAPPAPTPEPEKIPKVSDVIRIFFVSGNSDTVFLRWNYYEEKKVEILPYPDNRLFPDIFSRQKWSSDVLSSVNFLKAGMYSEEDIRALNDLLKQNSKDDLKDNLYVLFAARTDRVRIGSLKEVSGDWAKIKNTLDSILDEKNKKDKPEIPSQTKTQFICKFSTLGHDPTGMGQGTWETVTVYFRYGGRQWMCSTSSSSPWPSGWQSTSCTRYSGISNLFDPKIDFEQGYLYLKYMIYDLCDEQNVSEGFPITETKAALEIKYETSDRFGFTKYYYIYKDAKRTDFYIEERGNATVLVLDTGRLSRDIVVGTFRKDDNTFIEIDKGVSNKDSDLAKRLEDVQLLFVSGKSAKFISLID